MNSLKCACVLLVSACAFTFGDEAETKAMDRRIAELMERPARIIRAETWKRSKEERELLIREYRKRVHPLSEKSSVRLNLILLGDRDAVREAVEIMVKDPVHRDGGVGWSGSPYAIEYLAPYFYSDEPYSQSAGDYITSPLSFTAARTAVGILGDSSAFSDEVRSWVRAFKQPDPVALRAEMQRWWKQNKACFEREDWMAVKLGRDVPPPTILTGLRSGKPGSEDWQIQPKEWRMEVSATVPSTFASPNLVESKTKANDASGSRTFLHFGAGILALLTAALALFRLNARSSSGQ